jgi:thiamine-phosphate pyrophosphorylase
MRLRERPLVCAVSNRRALAEDDELACERLVRWAAALARAGVDLLQIRERGLDDGRYASLMRQVVAATRGRNTAVLVNDRLDIALASGADGVHLPASGLPPKHVRPLVPAGFVVGRSVHEPGEAVAIERDGGADYLVFGTVFPSASKPPDHPVSGVAGLRRACEAVRVPVLAIGGITLERAREAAAAGAAGVAAIGLFSRRSPDDIAGTVTAIREALSGVPGGRPSGD